MRISIGILARNEASHIRHTIVSLLSQDVMQDREVDVVQILVLPNGCTDNTAEVARSALLEGCPCHSGGRITWAVHELAHGGKSNAWNEFIHRFSDQAADYVFLVDADVLLHRTSCLSGMLSKLDAAPDAHVCAGWPVKHYAFKPCKTLWERVSLAGSAQTLAGAGWICGMLYCGRGSVLRRIWMPPGLLTEDGFLRAMVLTDRFTAQDNLARVIADPEAVVVYETYTRIRDIVAAQRRMAAGTAMNAIIYSHLWENSTLADDAGQIIRRKNAENPGWAVELVREHVRNEGVGLFPRGFLSRPLRKLTAMPIAGAIKQFPLIVLRALKTAIFGYLGNRTLESSNLLSAWRAKDTGSARVAKGGNVSGE